MNDPSHKLFGSRTVAVAYACVLLALVAITYWPIFEYSYVQDDLRSVDFIRTHNTGEVLSTIFNPHNRHFYRPLSGCYYLLIVRMFDLQAAGFHAGAMILLALGAWMAAKVIREITGDRLVAAGTGLLYAAATPIHIDTMTWMVGMNELGAMPLMLGSLFLFLRGRHIASAAVFLVALLFKEAVLFLPLLFLVHLAFRHELKSLPKKAISSLWVYGLILAMSMIPKLVAHPLTAMPDTHPYALRFFGFHVFGNLLWYSKWYFETLFPMFAESPWKEGFMAAAFQHCRPVAVGIAGLLVAAAAWLVWRQKRINSQFKPAGLILLLAWIPLGLLPVVFFPNHFYRYYLTYSLPPLLALFLFLLRNAAEAVARRQNLATAAVVLWIIVSVPFSIGYFHRRASEGYRQLFLDGTNGLFRRGACVNVVRNQLPKLVPHLPPGSSLIFQDVELPAFNGKYGVRVWLDDPTLLVFDAGTVARDDHGLFVELTSLDAPWYIDPNLPKIRTDLDPSKTFAFRQSNGVLIDFTKDFLAAHAARDTAE
jgi:hypothetical protein